MNITSIKTIICNLEDIKKEKNIDYIDYTDFGVYYINDSLSDWITYANGLPNIIVNELEQLFLL